MNTPEQKIVVLVPCYNEEPTIEKVVSDFRTYLPEARICVFDNNSTDRSAEFALNAGADVIKVPRQGKGNVIKQMFSTIDADIYVMVDGDDTYPANIVKELIAPVADGRADMVVGDRLSSTYFGVNQRPMHNAGNRLVRSLISGLFDCKIKDVMSGYRVFNRDFVKNFPIMSAGFEIETEMTIHALDKGYIIMEHPIEYRDRPADSISKLNTYSDGFKVLKTIAILFRDYRPFGFFSILALLLAIIGVVTLYPIFVEYFKTGLVPRFPTLIVACFVILAAIMLLLVGVILGAISDNNRRMFQLRRSR